MSAGGIMVGAAPARTVILLETEAKGLLQASTAVQVSVTVPPAQPVKVGAMTERAEVPVMAQAPAKPFEKVKVVGAGNPPQSTVISAGATIVGKAAGLTVIVLETEAKGLLQASAAVQVSVTVPPVQAFGAAEKVEVAEVPVTAQVPANPFVKFKVEAAGNPPQSTVILGGATMIGKSAGSTV
jgi:hypothetical protein